MKADNPNEAIEEFLGLPALEEEKGDWGFKGLKQAVKLEFKLGKYDKVRTPYACRFWYTDCYRRLLSTTLSS